MTYEIAKDNVLDCYIVWEVHKNTKIDKLHGTKKECEKWVKLMNIQYSKKSKKIAKDL